MFDVKTNSARYPVKYVIDNCGPDSGDWIVLTSEDANGHPMYCIGHRRGGTVHTFLANCGLTTRGKDQSHKEDLLTAIGIKLPRKCPGVLNDKTQAQPKVDSHNDLRQHVLAIEEAFRTESFPNRFLTTLMGLEFVDTFRALQYFHGETRGLKPVMLELAFYLLTNKYDETHGVTINGTTRSGDVAEGSGAPGAKSPQRVSPRTLSKKHVLVPLSQIVGWRGAASQLDCGICKTRTTMVCVECSTADYVVPLCKRIHNYNGKTVIKHCCRRHTENPEAARRAYPRKRARE